MLHVMRDNFAQAHYELLQGVMKYGTEMPTDYDKKGDILSLDMPAAIEVFKPFDPPIFSKCVHNDPQGMWAYRGEVVEGTHDHLAEQLSYTYHDRYKGQLDGVIEEIKRNPHTRRAQFITWIPEIDLGHQYPPCFQRGIIRVVNSKLDFHTHWRSRDLVKAWGSNVFGFAFLHKFFAEETGYPIGVYREFIDSLHVYGVDREAAAHMIERPVRDWYWPLEDILRKV